MAGYEQTTGPGQKRANQRVLTDEIEAERRFVQDEHLDRG
jgi:hypothetical protein